MKFLPAIILLIISSTSCQGQMEIAKIFNEHMVLQREAPIKFWGWSKPKDVVVANFDRVQQKLVTDENGYWEFEFEAKPAGGPFKLDIASARKKISWTDIYVGDVWMCSGQSNMEWDVKNSNNPEQELAEADLPMLRHFRVPRTFAEAPEKDLDGGLWEVSNAQTAKNFTAVGYFFAKEIIESEEVPIGLINTSWGGARIEPFMSAEANRIEDLPAYFEDLKKRALKINNSLKEKYQRKFKEFKEPKEFLAEPTVTWQAEKMIDENWSTLELPGIWEEKGLDKLDGVIWFRKEINLTSAEASKINSLHLGAIDDSDITWINGVEVGSMRMSYNVERNYNLQSGILKSGKNTIAIRVEDTGGGGGFTVAPAEFGFRSEQGMVKKLTGEWKINAEAIYWNTGFGKNATATLLYHKMIHPITKLPIKGVLWYQGESNAGPLEAGMYRDQFRSLILDWRKAWGQANMPFFFVQLANFMDPVKEPSESSWALLRESQATALDLPMTGMAVAIDIGEQFDIHPKNKQAVGHRLAVHALNKVYNKNVVFSGPMIKSAGNKEDAIVLSFEFAEGLKCSETTITGFAIGDAAGNFKWATAAIDGEQIILTNPGIENPSEVRYGWADNPAVNLYNAADLPMAPFKINIQ